MHLETASRAGELTKLKAICGMAEMADVALHDIKLLKILIKNPIWQRKVTPLRIINASSTHRAVFSRNLQSWFFKLLKNVLPQNVCKMWRFYLRYLLLIFCSIRLIKHALSQNDNFVALFKQTKSQAMHRNTLRYRCV